jgi:hypothetical protein
MADGPILSGEVGEESDWLRSCVIFCSLWAVLDEWVREERNPTEGTVRWGAGVFERGCSGEIWKLSWWLVPWRIFGICTRVRVFFGDVDGELGDCGLDGECGEEGVLVFEFDWRILFNRADGDRFGERVGEQGEGEGEEGEGEGGWRVEEGEEGQGINVSEGEVDCWKRGW